MCLERSEDLSVCQQLFLESAAVPGLVIIRDVNAVGQNSVDFGEESFVNLCPGVQLTALDVLQSILNDAGIECERNGTDVLWSSIAS